MFFPLLQVWPLSLAGAGSWLFFCYMGFSKAWRYSEPVYSNMKGKSTTNLQSWWRSLGWLRPLNIEEIGLTAWHGTWVWKSLSQCPKQTPHQLLFHQVHAPPVVWDGKLSTPSPCSNAPGHEEALKTKWQALFNNNLFKSGALRAFLHISLRWHYTDWCLLPTLLA